MFLGGHGLIVRVLIDFDLLEEPTPPDSTVTGAVINSPYAIIKFGQIDANN